MEIVTDLQGRYIYSEEGKVLVKLKDEDTLVYVDFQTITAAKTEEIETDLTHPTIETEKTEIHLANDEAIPATLSSGFDESECSRSWTRSEILQLISLYERHRHCFQSSTMKNEKVWKMISQSIKKHSPTQCENKFKYLKARYIKKVENMGPKRTGEPVIKFEYFEEMDAIFGKDHNVRPLAVASSMQGHSPTVVEATASSASESSSENAGSLDKPKLKKRKFDAREEARLKRHEESMKIKKEAIDTFKEYMDKLLKK